MPRKIRELKADLCRASCIMRPDDADVTAHYSLVIEWDPRDGIYVVTVPELEGCRTHSATYEEAVAQARDAIWGWLDASRTWGTPIPQPHSYPMTTQAALDRADWCTP